jgi:hypothetical protein
LPRNFQSIGMALNHQTKEELKRETAENKKLLEKREK